MKYIKLSTLFSLATLLLLATGSHAQAPAPAADASSLLYEISGKGLSKPSYVFGTMHAACESDVVPLATVGTYLNRTDQLLMELDLDNPDELSSVAGSVMIPGGKTLKDYLKPAEYAKVDAMVTNLIGASVEAVKTVRPLLLSVVLMTSPKVIGCAPPFMYDVSLAKLASDSKKPVIGLETAAEQIKFLDSKPIEKQAKELYEMAEDTPKAIKLANDLTAAYRTRNSDKLYEISISQSTYDKDFLKRLLDDRNSAWIPTLETSMKAKPSFVAVGAAHLGGKSGILSLLREKGYTVKAIKL